MIIGDKRTTTGAVAVILTLVFGLALWLFLWPAESHTQESTANSSIVAAARGRIDVDGGLSRILAIRDGVVHDVRVVEGQTVRKGDILGSLDPRQAEIAVHTAEAELAGLKARASAQARQVDRLKRAAKGQAISIQALDEGEASLSTLNAEASVAQSRLESARYELDLRFFRAPSDGRVARRLIKPGDVVSAQALTELFTLIPNTPRIVRAEIQEQFVNLIKTGLEAEIVSELDESIRVAGKVIRMGQTLELRKSNDNPAERVDVRVADCIVAFPQDVPFLIGQRVYVRFKHTTKP